MIRTCSIKAEYVRVTHPVKLINGKSTIDTKKEKIIPFHTIKAIQAIIEVI